MEEEASPSPSLQAGEVDDEYESKETVLQRYFLQEWKLVKSLLDGIVSARRVSDLSAVHKIRSIVCRPNFRLSLMLCIGGIRAIYFIFSFFGLLADGVCICAELVVWIRCLLIFGLEIVCVADCKILVFDLRTFS